MCLWFQRGKSPLWQGMATRDRHKIRSRNLKVHVFIYKDRTEKENWMLGEIIHAH